MLQVNTVLGAKPPLPRTGDLATADAVKLGGTLVCALGCVHPGDGGGGIFFWDTSSATDDGGTIIVPTGGPCNQGHWRRLDVSELHAAWFGAVDSSDPVDDTAAITAAIAAGAAWPRGVTLRFDARTYAVSSPVPGAVAFSVASSMRLEGTGGPPYGTQWQCSGPGSILELRGRGARVTNMAFYGNPDVRPRDMLIVHANTVSIDHVYVFASARHGTIVESGTVGEPSLLAASAAPAGTVINSNSVRLFNHNYESCGDNATGGDPEGGCGLYIHGSDAQSGYIGAIFAQICNCPVYEASLAGNVYVAHYSEGGQKGFTNANAFGSTLLGCYTEDNAQGVMSTPGTLLIGGSLPAHVNSTPQVVGGEISRQVFARTGADGVTFSARVPSDQANAAMVFWRDDLGPGTPSGAWSLAYEPTDPTLYPYAWCRTSYRWYRVQWAGGVRPDFPYGGPFGFTDGAHDRGAALGFMASPLLNTTRRWSLKQTGIALDPGANTVYLYGGLQNDGPAFYAQDAKEFAPYSETRVTIDVEVADEAALAADVRVGPHCWLGQTHGEGQVAVRVNSDRAVVVTLVWHFEAFVSDGIGGGAW